MNTETFADFLQPEIISSVVTGLVTAALTLITIAKGIDKEASVILRKKFDSLLEPLDQEIEDIKSNILELSQGIKNVKDRYKSISIVEAKTIYKLYTAVIELEIEKMIVKILNNERELISSSSEEEAAILISLRIKDIIDKARIGLENFTLINGKTLGYLVSNINPTSADSESLTSNIKNALRPFVKSIQSNVSIDTQKQLELLKLTFFSKSSDRFNKELEKLYPDHQ